MASAVQEFSPVEIKGAFLDDSYDQIESFEAQLKEYNNASDRKTAVERVNIVTSHDPRYNEVKAFLEKEKVDVFIVDNNFQDADSYVAYNGLQLIELLRKDKSLTKDNLFYVLYTAHPLDKKSEQLCDDLGILYLNKSSDFSQIILQITEAYNKRFPNRNYKAQIHQTIIAGPMDGLYYKYADIIESDLRKNKYQSTTIHGKEYTVEMLADELRQKSRIGEFLVSNYIEAMERIIQIRRERHSNKN
jgi:hypothetical protein